MKLLPEYDTASRKFVPSKVTKILLTASLYLGLTLPALAEKVEAAKLATVEHPENALLVGFFTFINYLSGAAILVGVVCCLIWFFQRKDDDVEEEGEGEGGVSTEVVHVAEPAGEAKADDTTKSESKPDQKTADETNIAEPKDAESKPDSTTPDDSKPEEAKSDQKTADEANITEPKDAESKPDSTTPDDSKPEETKSDNAPKADDKKGESKKAKGKKPKGS
jgi:type IV secretory pathway VirB10-like protein